jgi:alkylation response protein AidB-like acyl-CoA dehydrogenase
MTFDLSPEQQAARERARAFADDRVAPLAPSIDEAAAIPAEILRELEIGAAAAGTDATTLVVTAEELATVSAAVAAAGAVGQRHSAAIDGDAPGLRGFAVPRAATTRGRLALAGVALGIGRAAIESALALLRATPRETQDQEKPHWVVADAATDVAAARVLTHQAAQAVDAGGDADGPVAMAKLAAVAAAHRAVESALRVAGPEGFKRGSLLERLSRDVRAVSLLLGTEEDLRGTAASSLLPG